jgi:hypothetical protein
MVYIMCPKSLVSWSVNREGGLTEGTKILAPSINRESQSSFRRHIDDAKFTVLDYTITCYAARNKTHLAGSCSGPQLSKLIYGRSSLRILARVPALLIEVLHILFSFS